jgi:D-3-phosphoglycerate dehydrogenase / 2-oxoglutarate reductase
VKNTKKMTENPETFIFDFDSTFIKVEALDVLCEVIYQDSAAGEQILN